MLRYRRSSRRRNRTLVVLATFTLVGVATVLAAGVVASTAAQQPPGTIPARFYGSMGGKRLNRPIVGLAATPTGKGYWLVASDGGIFGFGDARFFGSMGDHRLNRPVVGIAATPTGKGYWLVASDGGIFGFGDARFHGSTGGMHLNRPVTGIAATPSGKGYWVATAGGMIYNFGAVAQMRSVPATVGYLSCDMTTKTVPVPALNIVGITANRLGSGIWLVAPNGRAHAAVAEVLALTEMGCMRTTLATPLEIGATIATGPGITVSYSSGYADSMSRLPPLNNVVGYATTPRATGLWIVASDGGVFVPRCDFAPPEACKI